MNIVPKLFCLINMNEKKKNSLETAYLSSSISKQNKFLFITANNKNIFCVLFLIHIQQKNEKEKKKKFKINILTLLRLLIWKIAKG